MAITILSNVGVPPAERVDVANPDVPNGVWGNVVATFAAPRRVVVTRLDGEGEPVWVSFTREGRKASTAILTAAGDVCHEDAVVLIVTGRDGHLTQRPKLRIQSWS